MERLIGTVSRGIRAPIIREGDDIAEIVVKSVLEASKSEGFALRDRDVVAVTEAVVARAQGNYATVEQIAADVRTKFGICVALQLIPLTDMDASTILSILFSGWVLIPIVVYSFI